MVLKLVRFAAWAVLGLICFVTLSPIGLRPETGSVGVERFAAYALMGVLFATAYPNRVVRWAAFLAIVAFGLEALQHLTPDRHGHLADAMEKTLGGWTGCGTATLARHLFESRFRREKAHQLPTLEIMDGSGPKAFPQQPARER